MDRRTVRFLPGVATHNLVRELLAGVTLLAVVNVTRRAANPPIDTSPLTATPPTRSSTRPIPEPSPRRASWFSSMRTPLDALRRWLVAHNAAVMSVLLLVIGVVMIGKGIGSF